MTQPLSHYFISSGHNSYLQGNQLTSTAGTNTIEVGLKHGCRVVELDVYDGPTEPVVTHGGTLTSSVTFEECVKAVEKHAFTAAPYPVILTLENHVKQQQGQMVRTLRHVLGHKLFIPEQDQLVKDGAWLSPEALKHKVVVRMKVKPGITEPELAQLVYICNSSIKAYDTGCGPAVPSSHSLPDSKLPRVPQYAGFAAASKMFSFRTPQAAQAAQAAEEGEDPEQIAEEYAAAAKAAKGQRVSNAAGQARTTGKAKAGVEAAAAEVPDAAGVQDTVRPAAVEPAAGTAAGAAAGAAAGTAAAVSAGAEEELPLNNLRSLSSFSRVVEDVKQEEALEEELDDTLRTASSVAAGPPEGHVFKPDLAAVLQYTSRHLLRCYPSAWRMLDNSNPNPAAAWSLGVSLAALNWQLWDQAIWVTLAFFAQQKDSGYVLKPEWMRNVNPQQPLPPRSPRTLRVHVLSAFKPQGHRVGVFKDDMYVELRVVGMPHDTAIQASPHKNNTGRLIVDQDFLFKVAYPEIAVLLVLLKDQDNVMSDTVLGYYGIPLASLAPGAYQLPMAEPKVMGGSTQTGMWVKLELQWQDDGESVGAQAAQ